MTQINQSGWKPEMKALSPSGEGGYVETFTGNRALMLEEPLIFEIGGSETCGGGFEFLPGTGRGAGGARGGAAGSGRWGGVWGGGGFLLLPPPPSGGGAGGGGLESLPKRTLPSPNPLP